MMVSTDMSTLTKLLAGCATRERPQWLHQQICVALDGVVEITSTPTLRI